jgi:hypothetical protein
MISIRDGEAMADSRRRSLRQTIFVGFGFTLPR